MFNIEFHRPTTLSRMDWTKEPINRSKGIFFLQYKTCIYLYHIYRNKRSGNSSKQQQQRQQRQVNNTYSG